jgi:Ala-tRNA(Pro) deacylase
MPLGTRLENLLHRNHTEYARSVHPRVNTAREVAFEEEISPHRVAKTVVFKSDKGFAMAVVPADANVDLPELSFVLGLSYIRLATEDELRRLFPDSEVGAMPPFGNLYGLPVVVDGNLAEADVIAFNAGTHQDVVYMRFADFKHLVQPAIHFFSMRSPAAFTVEPRATVTM